MPRNKTNNTSLWWFLFIYAIVFAAGGFVAGGVMGEQQGYETGLKDGLRSTLLVSPEEECKVINYNRGQ